ncbi:winged helix-turn-helix transcriptional regulator [Streptomyces sp. A7024]|uniref:Winged helix-turn-helix transcriptional regulator n=1 Tax=Streptomyces coryli TaxID=1128680 RepID=A0A6G4UF65_9ACTN|nr:helix-turn-helix domain-containing protein [Streptomyces coryli]NGN70451.1 winged helix-turn-helix transcriptional regulator [Streptomyces coryli]
MLQLTVDAAGLAQSRFAVSPLHEVAATLLPWGLRPRPGAAPWLARARRTLRHEQLPLLTACALIDRGYVPDFLSPHPAGPAPTIDEELALVRATPADRIVTELRVVRGGRPHIGLDGRGSELPTVLREALDRDGAGIADQAADELRRYWDLTFAAHWPRAKAELDADVDRCADILARRGAAALFSTLHPGMRWRDGTLEVASRFCGSMDVPHVVLVPSLLAQRPTVAVDQLAGPRLPPILNYPVGAGPTTAGDGPLAALLGTTRAGLLTALDHPTTTTSLATANFLSPATVSYHLGVLLRAGLVTRTRKGRSVLYRRTPQGSRLTN